MKTKGLIIGVVIVMLLATSANSHESNGFKHMEDPSGSIVKAMFCGDGSAVWWIDNNGDGVIDVCKRAFLDHGKLHIKLIEPVNNNCTCEEDN